MDLIPANIKYKNGFFDLARMDFSNGELSPLLLNIIDESIDSTIEPNIKLSYIQFIVSQFKEPDRLILKKYMKII